MAGFAIGNRVDETFMLMTLIPIQPTPPGGPNYSLRIRDYLDSLGRDHASPFRKVAALHFCRFVIIDGLPNEGYQTEADNLHSEYLMLDASIAGDWEVCVTAMLSEIPEIMHKVYENCVGFPGVIEAQGFVDYLRKGLTEAAFGFGAYPQASVYEVRRAISTQKSFRKFALAAQELPPEELQGAFQKFIGQLEAS